MLRATVSTPARIVAYNHPPPAAIAINIHTSLGEVALAFRDAAEVETAAALLHQVAEMFKPAEVTP